MTSSRSTANARLVARHQRGDKARGARAVASQFTKKQSSFERRQEEKLVAALLQHDASASLLQNQGTSGAGIPAAPGRGEAFQVRGSRTATTADSFTSRVPSESGIGLAGRDRGVRRPVPSLVTGAARPAISTATRSSRRVSRYQLLEEGDGQDPARPPVPAPAGGLLGAQSATTLLQDEAGAAPRPGPSKQERFQEVIASSRRQRAAEQRDRAARDEEATALDEAFEGLMHLLPRRDRREEEHRAFEASGSPEVRALLRDYKKKRGRGARQLVVRVQRKEEADPAADGSAARVEVERDVSYVVPLSDAVGGGRRSSRDRSGMGKATGKLDADDLQRLEEIRRFAEQSAAAEDPEREDVDGIDTMHAAQEAAWRSRHAAKDDEWDFDKTLHQFMMDPRRAHATQRLLTEEEEAAQAAERLRLQEDRARIPIDVREALESEDMLQRTRREWIDRGGDQAFQMGGRRGNDDDDDDGISLSSSESSDDDVEAERYEDGEAEEGNDLTDSGRKKKKKATPVTGSASLDELLTAVEHLANDPPPDAEDGRADETATTAGASPAALSFHRLVVGLYRLGRQHPVLLANTFRTVLLEAERRSLRGRVPDRALALLLLAATQLFPASDYRHPVMTPLLLYASSAVMQLRLVSRRHIKALLLFAGLLTRCAELADGRKFCPEALTAVWNLLALQVPQRLLTREGSRFQGLEVPFPLLHRNEDGGRRASQRADHHHSDDRPLLATAAESSSEASRRVLRLVQYLVEKKGSDAPLTTVAELLEETPDEQARLDGATQRKAVLRFLCLAEADRPTPSAGGRPPPEEGVGTTAFDVDDEAILCAAYVLLQRLADAFQDVAAFPALFLEPFEKLQDRLLLQHHPSSSSSSSSHHEMVTGAAEAGFIWAPSLLVARLHVKTLQRLRELSQAQILRRAPLAMRTFRPRPLRQFDPLLEEREEIAVKSEIRELKKTAREDRKRVLRHLQAEATVMRRGRERETAMREAERETRYRHLLGELQQQQHVMNTVDAAMERAKKKVKKGISGAPAEQGGDGGEGSIPSY